MIQKKHQDSLDTDNYFPILLGMKKRILVWLSGWVDSAVTAYLLHKAGHDVVAWFMINYTTDDESCTTKRDLEEAQRVADFLGIKLHTFDFQKEYHERIVRYIVDSYAAWLTPNPDVMCNSEVKFSLFLEEGVALGFDAVATGHYARIVDHGEEYDSHRFSLLKGIDTTKDQSYFLSGLDQYQLSKAIFPLWELTKKEVREIAHEALLPNADRKDSQGICFIGKVPMKTFLAQYIPHMPWPIVDCKGKKLGEHQWVWWYTIGQRKWICVAAAEPMFVIGKNITTNTLIIGPSSSNELYSDTITLHKRLRTRKAYSLPLHAYAKIRYRQDDQEVDITSIDSGALHLHFTTPQRAVASWQVVVIYDGNEVMGSGIIV
jgi:tRNA-uridine 2-sulfurtransferase